MFWTLTMKSLATYGCLVAGVCLVGVVFSCYIDAPSIDFITASLVAIGGVTFYNGGRITEAVVLAKQNRIENGILKRAMIKHKLLTAEELEGE